MIQLLLIGAGAVVEELYSAPLRRLEKAGAVKVSGVVDPNEARARRIASRFDAAGIYPDCGTAFRAAAVDLAIVASPPGLHADHACYALEQGSHVLCEKPMATTLSDAERMNAAAARADRVLGVAFARRFYAHFADVANLVAGGELGSELHFVYREGDTYVWPIATDAPFQRNQSGGGVLLDKGVHMLDQLNWIFGQPSLEQSFDDSLVGGVETNCLLELAFPHARGVMQVSWEYPLNNGLRIWGSGGEVVLNGSDIRTYLRKRGDIWMKVPATTVWPSDMARFGGKRTTPGNYYASFELQLIAMLRCVAYNEPFPVTGMAAERIQATLDEAYSAAKPLPCPWLSNAEQHAATANHWKGQPE